MSSISPQRLAHLLRSDPDFIVNFIVGNNPVGVADNVELLGMNRPIGDPSFEEALGYVLKANNGRDFVATLTVPLELTGFSEEQRKAIVSAIPVDASPQDAAGPLAAIALGLYSAAPEVLDEEAAEHTPKSTPPATVTGGDKNKRLFRALVVAGILLASVALGYAIAVARKKA